MKDASKNATSRVRKTNPTVSLHLDHGGLCLASLARWSSGLLHAASAGLGRLWRRCLACSGHCEMRLSLCLINVERRRTVVHQPKSAFWNARGSRSEVSSGEVSIVIGYLTLSSIKLSRETICFARRERTKRDWCPVSPETMHLGIREPRTTLDEEIPIAVDYAS